MSIPTETLDKLPDTPGVYTFVDAHGEPLYIGKATSLCDRVKSYIAGDLLEARGPGIVRMIERAADVQWEETDSVLEALILEVKLIKTHHPPYNTKEKDDKSFNYVIITDEAFPRVLLKREKQLADARGTSGFSIKYAFGPFPKGGALKEALKIIRKIFPFRDRCTPYAERPTGDRKPCFNAQIGLCPGVCTGAITKREYQKRIQNIRLLFEGKKGQLVKKLNRQMHAAAQRHDFEKAEEVKRTIFALEHIQDVALIKHDAVPQSDTFRVEGYDIAHISGAHVVGVMTVIENGTPDTDAYRKFKLRTITENNDVHALREVLERRLAHAEWKFPQLIVIDGGVAQKRAAERVLRDAGVSIPVASVVKDERHKPKNILGKHTIVREHEREILHANREAHRFAVKYHRQRRERIK